MSIFLKKILELNKPVAQENLPPANQKKSRWVAVFYLPAPIKPSDELLLAQAAKPLYLV